MTVEAGGGECKMGDNISSQTWSGCLGPRVVGKTGLGLSPGEQGRAATAGEASGGPRSATGSGEVERGEDGSGGEPGREDRGDQLSTEKSGRPLHPAPPACHGQRQWASPRLTPLS